MTDGAVTGAGVTGAGVTGAGVTVRAAAKINLHLGVGAVRADGFHPLATVYQAIGLYDDVTVEASDEWDLSIETAEHLGAVDVPVAGNLAERAGLLLARHHRRDLTGRMRIEKHIPVAGGMAGGSADAAAALIALDRLWGTETDDEALLDIAAELGSDVPFALLGGTAVGTGRGERVRPVPDAHTWWWVAVPSTTGLSTPEVYRHFDRLRGRDEDALPAPTEAVVLGLRGGDPETLGDLLHNDLEAPALDLRPDLRDLIGLGEDLGAIRGLVSGSGPTVVFLCRDADHARHLAADLAARDHLALPAPGPVAGATVVPVVR